MNLTEPQLRRLLFIRIGKGDGQQVAECIAWAASDARRRQLVNSTTRRGTPALIRAVRSMLPSADVVRILLKHGADPDAADCTGLTALEHARRRLLRYSARARRPPRRSPSLTRGGELILEPEESRLLDDMADRPGGEEFVELYLQERRRAAERIFDPRGELETIVELLAETR